MNSISFTLALGLALGQLTFLLHNTDFIVEYATKLGFPKAVLADEYKEWKIKNELEHGYPMFIRERFSTFWSRLFGCPFCFMTFSCLVLSIASFSWYFLLLGFAAAGISNLLFMILTYFYKKNFS